MKKVHLSFLVYMYVLLPFMLFAQDEIQIKGNVSDVSGKPLVGVNVTVRETIYGSSTDANGYYDIQFPDSLSGSEMTFDVRYMGYKTQSKTIKLIPGVNVINYRLEEDVLSLKTIVVTAQKRKENLQEVPISISALEKSAIEQSGSDRIAELQYFIPNMVVGYEYFTFMSQSSIRGISGSGSNIGMESRDALYIDGVYAGRSIALNQDLLDIERVEVLRGPQGTMFGKNTVSGVINLTTRKPSGRPQATLMVEGGNYNHFKTNLFLNVPLIENKLLAKFSGKAFFRDGYIKNVYNKKDLNGVNTMASRLQLRYFASEKLEFNFSLSGVRDRQNNRTILLETDGEGFELAPGAREVAHNAAEFQNRDLISSNLNIDYSFSNNFNLKSITALNWSKAQSRFDDDISPVAFIYSDRDEESRHFTQELQLASSFSRRTNFVAGLFYFNQKSETETNATFDADSPFGYYYIITPASVRTNSFAGYFHGNLNITDNLIFTAGLRYTYEGKKLKFNQHNDPEPFMFPEINNLTDELSESDLSPKGGLNFLIDENAMLYGTIARAHKSGGWNVVFPRSENLKFGPEYSTNYEIGLKSTWLHNRIRINAAGFLTKVSDYQVGVWIGTNVDDLLMVVKNAGKVTSKGFELELAAIPLLGLSVASGFGYTDAKYDEFKNGGGLGIHWDGHRLKFAPKTSYNIAIDYRFPAVSFGSLLLHGDYAFKDDMYSYASNEGYDFLAGYALLNARIGFEFSNIPLSFSIWGKNLADKLYMRDRGPTATGTVGAWYGMPRTFGLQVKYSLFK